MLQHLAGILRLADAMGALQLLRQTGFLANLRLENVLVDALDRRQVEPVLAAVLGERTVVQGHKIQRIHLGLVVGPVRVDMFGKKFELGGLRHSVAGLVGCARRCSCFRFGLGRRFSVVGTGRHSVDFYLFRVEQRCITGGPGVLGPVGPGVAFRILDKADSPDLCLCQRRPKLPWLTSSGPNVVKIPPGCCRMHCQADAHSTSIRRFVHSPVPA